MGLETVGLIFGAINTIAGLAGGKKAPSVQTTAPQDVANSANADKARQAALLETQGGSRGQELSPDEVSRRPTLFGN